MPSPRRLAAIMFTDMVGYTVLGQRNEALSLALLREQQKLIRPILKKHNGREVKTIGDAFLVEFGSALDAIQCAYDIQRASRELNFSRRADQKVQLRIGLHLGDVEGSGKDILGDAVNVASRIEPLAEPGGISLSRQVADPVRNKFELPIVGFGVRTLKSVAEPVELFRVVLPWEQEAKDRPGPLDPKRVAVLPFASYSPDPGDAYFSDGLTEELIARLSLVKGLEVIARTSVMAYKNEEKSVAQVGSELGAGTILEGSVRKVGNRVRVTAQLINAMNQAHLWTESYDRELSDVFAVQGDIAGHVAESLHLQLLGKEREQLGRRPTSSNEAYLLYLQGRDYTRRFTPDGVGTAIDLFHKAIAIDPRFAQAHLGLAAAQLSSGFLNFTPEDQAYALARDAAKRALELDESLAEGHYILGRTLVEHSLQPKAAEIEYRRGLELEPNNAQLHSAYSWLLAARLNRQAAAALAEKAVRLDPKSAETWRMNSYTFYMLADFDRGVEYGHRSIELSPLDPTGHLLTALNLVFVGKTEAAIQACREAMSLAHNHAYYRASLAGIYGFAGRLAEARELIDQLNQSGEAEASTPAIMAWAYVSVGDFDQALDWLEKAYRRRSAYLVYYRNDPSFVKAGFDKDPRFRAFMRRTRLAG